MNALAQSATPISQNAAVPLLRTLVLCDLVNSTALIERLGDQRAADVIRKHDRLARTLMQTHAGREIDKTDGFLVMFDRPIQAVAFALDYQRELLQLNADEKTTLSARIGVHVGDVLTWDNDADDIAKGAKPVEIEGLVKPITSRLMQLALPNQILLSGVAYSLAHRAQGELGARLETVRWRTHGRYRFKGIPDPIPVFEVGEEGRAPLKAPPWSGKAHREVPFWRRPATMVMEGFVLLALIAIPAWYLLKPAPAIAFSNRDWVVVGDLKNLTGESKFDDSLQTAFRIGLEQSRYVNVMSDLKMRETIKMMQRDPEKTAIDRAVGSEIAIRDGARALILPTVAEIGGRVRVTAEVVDPNTQTTVYSESADGAGEQSVLPSLDKVNQQLRVRLGEALATVSNESKPLDNAATKNLDALRAYSLARRAYATANYKETLPLLQQAVTLDPDFALARTLMASVYLNIEEKKLALGQIDRAMQSAGRLANRDRLYVEAWKATFGAPVPALAKWKALTQTYPDFFLARGAYGFFVWQFANHYDEATRVYMDLDSPAMPSTGSREAILGVLELGNEKYAKATELLDRGAHLGLNFSEYRASAAAAQRNFGKASEMMASRQRQDIRGQDVSEEITRISLAVDQGQWAEAWMILEGAKKATPPDKHIARQKLETVDISLRGLTLVDENIDWLSKFIREESSAFGEESPMGHSDAEYRLLFAAYLAAMKNDLALARKALSQMGNDSDTGYPILDRMRAVAKAEIARVEGRPQEAIKLLTALPIDGTELCITHVALLDAYAASGDTDAAIGQARWLATHRGRAYSEYNSDRIATPFNVAQSDLAILREAELLQKSGKINQSKERLKDFTNVWRQASDRDFMKRRIEALNSKLERRAQ